MKKILVLFLLIGFLHNSFAQLVNIENKRKGQKEGVQGLIGLSIDLKQNTKSIVQLKNSLALQYKRKSNTLLLFNELSFLHADTVMRLHSDNALINSGFQHLRYNYSFENKWLTGELFVQHQSNRVKLLERRFITGGGPRIRLAGNDTTKYYFYLAPLLMYEKENLYDPDDDIVDKDEITNVFKGDFYVSGGYQFNNIFSIMHVTYYQPDLSNWNDFRISSDTSFKIKVTNKLALNISASLDYDSKPPLDRAGNEKIPKLFYSLHNKISYSF